MKERSLSCLGADGVSVFVRAWETENARALVVIAHGAAEHSGRYARFAATLTQEGISIFAPDHRGHGQTARELARAGHAGPDGFNGMIRDLRALIEKLGADYPGKKLFIFGHSMGALLVQRFVQLHGDSVAGVMLSGSPGIRPKLAAAAERTAKVATSAPDQPSELFRRSFASFNQGFESGTGYEWLSRDAEEVRKYVDDPWCGFPFANRLVAEMSACALEAADPANIARIPKSLPFLFVSGTHDPVGGNGEFVEKLAARYREAGIRQVQLTLYPDGRHEMLNDINRSEVERDIVAWLNAQLRGQPS